MLALNRSLLNREYHFYVQSPCNLPIYDRKVTRYFSLFTNGISCAFNVR
jgi:hypothetical protein